MTMDASDASDDDGAMQTSGRKTHKRGAPHARLGLAAAFPILAFLAPLALPAPSPADPVTDTVCQVRVLLSPLLGACVEAEPDPGPSPNPKPSSIQSVRPSTRASTSPVAPPKARTDSSSTSGAEAPAPPGTVPPSRTQQPAPSGRDADIVVPVAAAPGSGSQPKSLPFASLDILFTAALSGGLVALIAMRRRRNLDQMAADAAARVERMKDELVSNLSHELRTPLTPVVGYAKMLRTGKVSSAETRKIAEKLIGASAQLERTIDLLVTFAAIRGGSHEPRRDAVDVAAVANDVAADHRRRNPNRQIVVTAARSVPQMIGDTRLIRSAIDQLVDNAIKFSPAGKHVTVCVHPAAADPTMVEIAVADQGIGIAPAEIEEIFNEFHQADASSTRRFGGVGLGLAFAADVATMHGGAIDVRSMPGEGSVFTLRLAPIAAPRPIAVHASTSAA